MSVAPDAQVAELVDALVSGTSGESRGGSKSSPGHHSFVRLLILRADGDRPGDRKHCGSPAKAINRKPCYRVQPLVTSLCGRLKRIELSIRQSSSVTRSLSMDNVHIGRAVGQFSIHPTICGFGNWTLECIIMLRSSSWTIALLPTGSPCRTADCRCEQASGNDNDSYVCVDRQCEGSIELHPLNIEAMS